MVYVIETSALVAVRKDLQVKGVTCVQTESTAKIVTNTAPKIVCLEIAAD